MSEWYEIDAAWDASGYASDALLKLGETREWGDLVDVASKGTHATAEEVWDGMAKALRGYLESLDELEIDHTRIIIDALRAYYGKGKTKLTDDQIAKGVEHYRPKMKVDIVVIDELRGDAE